MCSRFVEKDTKNYVNSMCFLFRAFALNNFAFHFATSKKKRTFVPQKNNRKRAMNLNSKHWCDIVFEGRNKNYGAYKLRRASSRRHAIAFCITVAFAALAIIIPTVVETIYTPNFKRIQMDESLHVSLLQIDESDEFKRILRQYEAPPPNPAPPVISDEVDLDDTPPVELLFEDIKKKTLI